MKKVFKKAKIYRCHKHSPPSLFPFVSAVGTPASADR